MDGEAAAMALGSHLRNRPTLDKPKLGGTTLLTKTNYQKN
jgi:hypothetical protein